MRIKIGDKFFDGSEKPIMIIFDQQNDIEILKLALANKNWQGKFSRSPKNFFKTKEEKIKWMDDVGKEEEFISKNPLCNLVGE